MSNNPIVLDNSILFQGDCLEIIDTLISQSVKVDAIITSPPYNMNLRVNSGRYMSRCGWKYHDKEFSTKYPEYPDDLPMEDYFEFQKKFIEKAMQLTDIMFYNIQFLTGNKVALCRLLGYFADKIKEIIIWDKINAQPAMMKNTLNSQYEFIIIFQNSKPYNRMFDSAHFERGTLSNVWNVKREKNKISKASFPTELVSKILTNFTKEKDVILDPFMGSGTTGVACKNLNRKFIGIELHEETFNKAVERIKNEQ